MDSQYKHGRDAAVDAIVASDVRHKLDRRMEHAHSYEELYNANRAKKEASIEKIEAIEDMIQAAEKTDRIEIAVTKDRIDPAVRSVVADFDPDGEMSLHAPKNRSTIIDRERRANVHTPKPGENSRFVRNVTGNSLSDLINDKYKKLTTKYGLTEDYSELFEDAINS